MSLRGEDERMSGEKAPMSGAKGFALIIGGMFAVMLVLWLIATLAAP
ncbi:MULTISPECIES: hypothetical protein [Thermomonospora]|uniref:Preprotein translocase subunit SecG n=1 Tax=Thermomonospora cellulosilytica TaxID=1411118 RepID=A0A7W3R686_9ACTN|nr:MULTISPECIES: hypothetical protein [Thermomonospora]MBA9001873.1 preprotein translocase subunit SecG [Thermomonospora cellulosilytica]